MSPRELSVDVQAGRLEVLVWDADGTGMGDEPVPTVLALHGFPESANEWRPVAEILARNGVRVVAPLQRGYSPGARPTAVEDYSIELLAEDVLAVAEDLQLGAFHLVGHDWGACVAWWLAGHQPNRLTSLVAISVPHLGAFAEAIGTDPDQQERSAYFTLFREPGKAEDVLLADGARRLRAMFTDAVPEDLVTQHMDVVGTRDGLTGALNWYRAMRSYELPDVSVPTTFIWGDQDMAIARSGAEATAERMTGDYRFVPVSGGGHWIPEENPELVAAEVLARVR
ncbi:alpha/beta hydrolase [Dietzia aerolata]|uniref:Alpha/beta fold hydrolase n=1 Tax=Dietzia aerolata TaxID=595984 RepID=A0ABV5JUI6_9ACTN|nr:alpha/beta hydrolase [Dietzia aerolata]MBB0967559.1 alpha/beta hydrolase [Dietzia aerolata]HIW66760.1 alpha/beta hydrolase [Candidatus Dietzia merdigallinarum]